ncbi:MAG: hypothetical protein WDN28_18305 [Chthoniobacter sp.]
MIIVGAGDQFEVLGNIPMGDSEGTRATLADQQRRPLHPHPRRRSIASGSSAVFLPLSS